MLCSNQFGSRPREIPTLPCARNVMVVLSPVGPEGQASATNVFTFTCLNFLFVAGGFSKPRYLNLSGSPAAASQTGPVSIKHRPSNSESKRSKAKRWATVSTPATKGMGGFVMIRTILSGSFQRNWCTNSDTSMKGTNSWARSISCVKHTTWSSGTGTSEAFQLKANDPSAKNSITPSTRTPSSSNSMENGIRSLPESRLCKSSSRDQPPIRSNASRHIRA
mmetsp:Transcript_50678/g.135043  ORF Transcript_50678/g.135043 Transcript_50678/m.135043 type:complete len:221 (+) Transcript_50678:604-1266(+)